jgi:3-hydroxyisobutyrate dehydrogenase-like beta-hydroxyacid dehydrogenase
MVTTVGFIALGNMGKSMALNILKAGFPLTVHDTQTGPVEELVELGADAAASPEKVAQASEVVWMMLHPWHVKEVLLGERGVLRGAAPGTIVVDGGNCDPLVSERHAAAAAARGVTYLDAGCSGALEGAREGTLAIMVGGDKSAFDKCLPVFGAVGRQATHFGASGSGHLAKIINNIIIAMMNQAIAEALTLATEAGLDPGSLLDTITTGAARSWLLSQASEFYHTPEAERYEPTFADENPSHTQDGDQVTWALRMAHQLGLSLPMTGLTHELSKASASGGRTRVHRTAAQLAYNYAGVRPDDRNGG